MEGTEIEKGGENSLGNKGISEISGWISVLNERLNIAGNGEAGDYRGPDLQNYRGHLHQG